MNMNKKLLFVAVVAVLSLTACVAKHPKCAAYDKAPIEQPVK
jgi:outer membrane biogenesis lipoprotein LolB